MMAAVRRARSGYALALGLADLAGMCGLDAVVTALSGLADRLIEPALAAAIAQRTPDAGAPGFAIVGLGKLGGRELNYSSDVDLLFLYDPKTLPRKPREEPDQAALRIAQRIVEILQKRTEDGYAFRVDLRLRPAPPRSPATMRSAAISSTRSPPPSGGGRSITGRSARSARSAAGSATIMRKARRSPPATTASEGPAASAGGG